MGLYAEFSAAEMGYKEEIEGGNDEIGYEIIMVDYTEAYDAFVSTFLDIATTLVPVDTGYLRSTIDASHDGFTCWAEATADYAEYVEYGTSYMSAQPYFTPALEEAMRVFHSIARDLQSEAQAELEELLSGMMNSAMSMMSGGGNMFSASWGQFFGGLAMMAGMFFLFFPLLVYTYGIIDSTIGALTGKDDRSMEMFFMPEIIIT